MANKNPIPEAALDDRLAFVGTSGSGKTYSAGTCVERLLDSGARVVVVDPLDVWWGLRLIADGESPSRYSMPIFGGAHGDLPMNEAAGALVGETVAGMAESCIVSLGGFATKAAERRFMLAFLDAIYRKANGEPVHLIFDEADLWAPQKASEPMLQSRMEEIVRRGRVRGLISWLITQRPAVISKDVLSMADGLVAFKMTSSQDRDALEGWIEGQADRQQWRDIRAALPTLQPGTGVVWIPGRGVLETAAFPPKRTFDSSRTPKRGENRQAATLKPLDLGALKARLATIEADVAANDPKALKAEVAKLKAELAKPRSGDDAALRAEIARLGDEVLAAHEEGRRAGFVEGRQAGRADIAAAAAQHLTAMSAAINKAVDEPIPAMNGAARPIIPARSTAGAAHARLQSEPITARALRQSETNGAYTRPQMRILRSLAMWKSLGHEAPSREMVAAVAGYSPSSGGFNNLIGGLGPKALGAISIPRPGYLSLEASGVEVPTVDEARDILLSTLSNPQKKLVEAMNGAGILSREKLGQLTDYSATSGGFNNLIGSLNTIGVSYVPQQGHVALSDWAQSLLA